MYFFQEFLAGAEYFIVCHSKDTRPTFEQVNIAHSAITPAHLSPPPFLIFFDPSKNEHAMESMWFLEVRVKTTEIA